MPTKLSDLPEITALNGNELLYVVDGEDSRKITVANSFGKAVDNTFADYGGTADAITLTSPFTLETIPDGFRVRFRATATNTGAATINLDGTGAKPVLTVTGVALPAGYILLGNTGAAVETVVSWSVAQDSWIADRAPELGSNADGYFERFANGRMVCTARFTKTGGTNVRTFSFPATFVSADDITANVDQFGATSTRMTFDSAPTVSEFQIRVLNSSDGTTNTADRNGAIQAIGRWY